MSISFVSNYFLSFYLVTISIFIKLFCLSSPNLKTIEVVIPELPEMRTAHIVSVGSEALSELNPDFEDRYVSLPY